MRAIRRFTVRTTPARAARPAGRARHQPALVVAPADARPVRGDRPRAVGRRWSTTRSGCSGEVSAERLDGAGRRRRLPATGCGAAHEDLQQLPDRRPRGTRCARRRRTRRRRHRATSRRSSASPHVLPAVLRRPRHPGRRPPQGGQRPRRPDRRRRPALPQRATSAVAVARTAGSRSATRSLDPHGLPLTLAATPTDGTPLHGRGRPARAAARLAAHVWKAQVGRVPLLLLDSDVEENDAGRARGHRPAVRRRQRAPAAAGDAAGHRRRARGPRALPHHRAPGARRSSTPTRATPASSASSGSASSSRTGTDLRRGARGGPRRHRLHHAHAGARPASTGSRAT